MKIVGFQSKAADRGISISFIAGGCGNLDVTLNGRMRILGCHFKAVDKHIWMSVQEG